MGQLVQQVLLDKAQQVPQVLAQVDQLVQLVQQDNKVLKVQQVIKVLRDQQVL